MRLKTKTGHYAPTEEDLAEFAARFPGADIRLHLHAAADWLEDAPKSKLPKDGRRFVLNWLRRNSEDEILDNRRSGQRVRPRSTPCNAGVARTDKAPLLGWPPNEPGIDEDERTIRKRVIALRKKTAFLSHPAARRLAIRQLRGEGRIPPLGACRRVQDDACKRGLF